MSDITEALRAGGKRVRTHDAQIVFKAPSSAKELVERVAGDLGVSEAHIHREALAEWFEKRGYRN